MLKVFKVKAYAKVNFNLKVLPKRQDGFHNIESIFQTIDLYDELIVRKSQNEGCKVICDSINLPENNTLNLAYLAFAQISGCEVPGIEVYLKKGIPSGGGLGGGSSDAAALVRVLEKMCGRNLSDSELDFIASKTGSDVFFFMHCDKKGKGCALVSGRGEKVKKISSRRDLFLLLIFPEVSSSTKEAYALVDELLLKGDLLEYPKFEELESVYTSPPEKWIFNNTFTLALRNQFIEIDKALEYFQKLGAEYTQMSGSGSTVFGVFSNKQQAIYCCNLLAETCKCKLVRTF